MLFPHLFGVSKYLIPSFSPSSHLFFFFDIIHLFFPTQTTHHSNITLHSNVIIKYPKHHLLASLLNHTSLSKTVSSPKLQTWLSQLLLGSLAHWPLLVLHRQHQFPRRKLVRQFILLLFRLSRAPIPTRASTTLSTPLLSNRTKQMVIGLTLGVARSVNLLTSPADDPARTLQYIDFEVPHGPDVWGCQLHVTDQNKAMTWTNSTR